MKITTHGENLIQLTRLMAFNCYLVREDDGFTLIDAGLSGSGAAILKAAEDLGAPIRRIALTHAHTDHVGSLDALHELLPEAEVAISARDARLLAGDFSPVMDEAQSKVRGGFSKVSTKPTRLLLEGERVGSLEVIASPGHTPGHIAFFDGRDGTLIAGDAFTSTAGLSTAGSFRLLFPFPAMATWHKPTGLASALRLAGLGASRLAVGHGPVLENPAAAMQQAIAEAERRLGSTAYAAEKAN